MTANHAERDGERPSPVLILVRSLATGFLFGGVIGLLALFAWGVAGTFAEGFLVPAIPLSFLVGAAYGLAVGLTLGISLAIWVTFASPTVATARRVLSLMSLGAIALLVVLGLLDVFIGLLAIPLAVVSTWIGIRLVLMPTG